MVRKAVLAFVASLFLLLSSCGIPNYFSYSSSDFDFGTISLTNNTAEVYIESSIVQGVRNGTYEPILNTPKLYLMYAIYGTAESPSSTLRSAMNSTFKGKVKNMPTSRLDKYYRYLLDGENYVYYYVYPFKQVSVTENGFSPYSGTFTGTLDYKYFYETGDTAYLSLELIEDPSSTSGRLLQLTMSDGAEEDGETGTFVLCRLNKESFTQNINDYNDDSDDEFDEDDKLSEMIVPSLHVFASVSCGYYSYTNIPYISAKEIATFSFNDIW